MEPARAGASSAAPARRVVSRRRPRLLVLGDLTVDVVIRRAGELAVGSDVAGTIEFRAGGSAANVARAFAGLGGEAVFAGAVGDDAFGRQLVKALRADRVRVHVRRVRAPTARLAVLVDARGERSFVTHRGAADQLRPSDVRAPWIERADALHMPAYSLIAEPLGRAARTAIERARRAGRLVSIDLASRRPLLAAGRVAARRLIGEVDGDVLFANADEARALVGKDARRLLQLAPLVVIKEGASGCRVLWLAGSSPTSTDVLELDVATAPLKVSDTTGAGDAFDAGFLYVLLEQAAAERPRAQPRSLAVATDRTSALRRAQLLRRAATAGHRAAAALLTARRPELEL